MLKWLRNDEKGFTLVELMMVIVILGVLAGVAVPMVGNMRKNAVAAKLGSYADSIGTAVVMDMMTAVTPVFPTDATGITDLVKFQGETVPTTLALVFTKPAAAPTVNTLYISHNSTDKSFTIFAYSAGQATEVLTRTFSYAEK